MRVALRQFLHPYFLKLVVSLILWQPNILFQSYEESSDYGKHSQLLGLDFKNMLHYL